MNPNEQFNPIESPSPQNSDNPLAVMQPGEQVVCEIKRTPVGLISTYISGSLAIVAMVAIAVLVPHFASNVTSQAKALIDLLLVFVAIIVCAFVYVSIRVYSANRWILTTDSITEVYQTGLFRKRTSQMGLGELEDVSVRQEGVLQSMFHFGTLYAETAGERSRFVFPWCPDPNQYAQEILRTREVYEQGHRDELKSTANGDPPYGPNTQVPQPPANPPAQTPPSVA